MSADITSQVIVLQSLSGASYSLSWSGSSPVGDVIVEGSNDYSIDAQGNVSNAGTWIPLELNYGGQAVTAIPLSGNTGKGLIDITKTMIYAIRVFYDRTSGTGTLNVVFNGKVA
jgi:hypothetical protein